MYVSFFFLLNHFLKILHRIYIFGENITRIAFFFFTNIAHILAAGEGNRLLIQFNLLHKSALKNEIHLHTKYYIIPICFLWFSIPYCTTLYFSIKHCKYQTQEWYSRTTSPSEVKKRVCTPLLWANKVIEPKMVFQLPPHCSYEEEWKWVWIWTRGPGFKIKLVNQLQAIMLIRIPPRNRYIIWVIWIILIKRKSPRVWSDSRELSRGSILTWASPNGDHTTYGQKQEDRSSYRNWRTEGLCGDRCSTGAVIFRGEKHPDVAFPGRKSRGQYVNATLLHPYYLLAWPPIVWMQPQAKG